MDDENKNQPTLLQTCLFYTTAFFVLLGIFSLFSFLFLVPFVIDPAFTTIFMEFDEVPAICVTVKTNRRMGVSNCSWTSCREGCTKDIYDCTQILVNYTPNTPDVNLSFLQNPDGDEEVGISNNEKDVRYYRNDREQHRTNFGLNINYNNAFNDYNYDIFSNAGGDHYDEDTEGTAIGGGRGDREEDEERSLTSGLRTHSKFGWYYREARLLPNVKGCGYPPSLNCTKFLKTYKEIGKNYSCYYSRVDPSVVISHLDMWEVYRNLVYALAVPIPSFILSIIYLAVAYFKIYNDDEERAPLKTNAESMDVHEEPNSEHRQQETVNNTSNLNTSGAVTPVSDTFREGLNSFGYQFKVAMVDELSRDSLDEGVLHPSSSNGGNLSKAMTTSISTVEGPIADM